MTADVTIPLPRSGWMPPRFFLLFLLGGVALHFALGGPSLRVWPLGAALIVAGAALAVWGERTFVAAGATLKPFERSRLLVERGPFRFSRNPMYLSMVVIAVGTAFALGTPAPWLAALGLALVLRFRFIRNEERALAASLGEPYVAYCRRVRRWI